ncbi:MAG: peptidase M16 [Gaiellaceae bacterium]|jgi:predicted Zn-dependent peptidase|nr:MAG: peptidase M16 [Gaiellaceae bacterium]
MAKHRLSELPTGERVVSERLPGVRSVALGLWVGTGSRDEPEARAGVAHFIEHLLFRGSSRYSALEIAEIFDALGGELNAATSRETTAVYARVADSHLETALDVMADMVYRPTFADVDLEREVVLEEIAMVDDTPHDLVHDLAAEAVFGGHPLGRPVIGRAEVIASVSRRALSAYHKRAYAGPRVVLAAAGSVAHERLLELFAARIAGRASVDGLRRKPLRRLPAPSTRFLRKDTEQYHVCLAGPGLARNDERRFAAALLDAIVGGSASSRLFQEIREKRGLAYSVYSYTSQYEETGQIGLYVGTREEHLAECLAIVVECLADVAAGNVSAAELSRAKENVKGRLLLSLESTSNRMTRLGQAVVTGVPILGVPEVVRRTEAVTGADVADLASELFDPERLSVAGIGPSEEAFEAAVAGISSALIPRAA